MADRSNRRPVRKVVAGVSVAAIAAVTLLVSTTAALSTFADGEHSKFQIQSAQWTRAQPRVEPEQPTVTPGETWDIHSADPVEEETPRPHHNQVEESPAASPSASGDPAEEPGAQPTPTVESSGESVS